MAQNATLNGHCSIDDYVMVEQLTSELREISHGGSERHNQSDPSLPAWISNRAHPRHGY
jgi:hypothetical protein